MARPAPQFTPELLVGYSSLPLDLSELNQAAEQFVPLQSVAGYDPKVVSGALNEANNLLGVALGGEHPYMSLFIRSAYAFILDPTAGLEEAGMHYSEVYTDPAFFAYVPPTMAQMVFAEDMTTMMWTAEVSGLGLVAELLPTNDDDDTIAGQMGRMNEYLAPHSRLGVPLTNNVVTISLVPSGMA